MPATKLQIKHLSSSGELIQCVNCHGGFITVFRSHANTELAAYQRALSGVPGPERFVILLDNQPFEPTEHTLIGFGEHFSQQDGSVADLLGRAGLPEGAADAFLMSFGLDGIAAKACNSLTNCEERRVRLLAAMHAPNTVLVLNNPFEPIASQWRERFAESLVSSAKNQKRIIAVTSLSYRPQCWIDNELIARTQIGEHSQRTIGYGQSPSDMNKILTQVRAIIKEEQETARLISGAIQSSKLNPAAISANPAQNPHAPAQHSGGYAVSAAFGIGAGSQLSGVVPARDTKRILEVFAKIPRTVFYGGTAAVAAVSVAAIMYTRNVADAPPAPVVEESVAVSAGVQNSPPLAGEPAVSTAEAPPAETLNVVPVSENKVEEPINEPPPLAVHEPPKAEPPVEAKIVHTLDLYAPEIRNAVVKAFEGEVVLTGLRTKGESVLNNSAGAGSTKGPKGKAASKGANLGLELLSQLQRASSSDEGGTVSPVAAASNTTNVPTEQMDVEQRRELIRQKFLDAIQRAKEKREAEGG